MEKMHKCRHIRKVPVSIDTTRVVLLYTVLINEQQMIVLHFLFHVAFLKFSHEANKMSRLPAASLCVKAG